MPPPPDLADAADHARIRDLLRGAGYDAEGIAAVAGSDLTALGRRGLPVIVRRTRGGTPLETLVRLFTAGVPVARADAERALAPIPLPSWCAWGLLEADADTVRASVQLAGHGDLLLATDWGPETPNVGTAPDYVMGFSPSTLTLSRLTVRRRAGAALDLGTGCGLQGLLAAAHSERVVATDLNPRAVRMARFNAALNAVPMECREGDMFAPVQDERFDLVVSNPPFVVGPTRGHLFMSGGREVDALCADLARGAPRHLNPSGWCQFLANWAVVGGEDWRQRLARWFEGGDCDTWVIRRERQPADEYAALWIETDRDDAEEYAVRFAEWMAYYQRHRVEAVDYGLVSMRRRRDGAPGRLRCDDLQGSWDQADGESVAAAMERQDWLARSDDEALLDARLRVADSARLSRELVAVRGEWVPVAARLRAADALAEPGGIDPHGEGIVAACDGATPLRVLLQRLAETLGVPLGEVAPGALGAVRGLVDRGVLLPPGEGSPTQV